MTVSNRTTWPAHHFYAMGSHINAWLDLTDQHLAQSVLRQVEALFQAAEARLTRFRATSELAQLNAQAGQWTTVSNVFWRILTQALRLSQATDGLFDPTVLNAVATAGYDRDFAELAQPAIGQATKSLTLAQPLDRLQGCWQAVELDPAQHGVRLPPGIRLDFGGIAKGETAQQAVAFLSQWGPCLVDAGGDLVAGDAPAGWPGWLVAIASPTLADEPERDLAQIWLKNSALATAGIDYRRWQQGNATRHHVIDPRTGAPAATDLLTVSVLAADATVAEAWAKAGLIAGAQAGGALLHEHRLPAALVDQQQRLTLTPALQPFVQRGV
ncbi:MAG: FAD:protein FMN transferase [Caldilinea sp. CFX5]|nr:FAD:protein FMN transferase [Caldilinea sp. CFX5]